MKGKSFCTWSYVVLLTTEAFEFVASVKFFVLELFCIEDVSHRLDPIIVTLVLKLVVCNKILVFERKRTSKIDCYYPVPNGKYVNEYSKCAFVNSNSCHIYCNLCS